MLAIDLFYTLRMCQDNCPSLSFIIYLINQINQCLRMLYIMSPKKLSFQELICYWIEIGILLFKNLIIMYLLRSLNLVQAMNILARDQLRYKFRPWCFFYKRIGEYIQNEFSIRSNSLNRVISFSFIWSVLFTSPKEDWNETIGIFHFKPSSACT